MAVQISGVLKDGAGTVSYTHLDVYKRQSPGMARICLYGDLQRFGRRIDLRVKTGAEAIRALATHCLLYTSI